MIKALMFDLDGTLVNNDHLHYQTWQEKLLDHNIEIDEAVYKTRFSGRTNSEIVLEFFPELSPQQVQEFIDQRESLYRSRATQLTALPELLDLLAWAGDRYLQLA